MAVDTAGKRFSVLGLAGIQTLPIPDGTVAAVDRLHLLMLYSGIAADAPAVTTTHANRVFAIGSEARVLAVGSESRTLAIGSESRTLAVDG